MSDFPANILSKFCFATPRERIVKQKSVLVDVIRRHAKRSFAMISARYSYAQVAAETATL